MIANQIRLRTTGGSYASKNKRSGGSYKIPQHFMTKEEFITKYGKSLVKFEEYYKYSFTYSNDEIKIKVGGDSADIYRASLSSSQTVESLIYQVSSDYAYAIVGEEAIELEGLELNGGK